MRPTGSPGWGPAGLTARAYSEGMRRAKRLAGTTLIVIGVLAIAWGLVTWRWNDPVTSLYTRWEQNKLADTYEKVVAPKFALPAALTKPTTTAQERMRAIRAAATQFRNESHAGEPIGRIRIPRLGLNMVLVNGTDTASLRLGPGRDPRTFMPGEGQLVYIAGHRTTYLAPFAEIDKMRNGDRITIKMPYATFTYAVTGHTIVASDDLSVLESHGREVVALQACHPRFLATQRYIVWAKPVRVVPAGD